MNMEGSQHMALLQSYCRLCGEKRAIDDRRKPLSKYALSRDIQQSLNVDVQHDSSAIHPPFVCDICRRKLQRWRASVNKKKKAVINITVPFFAEHSNSCNICSGGSTEEVHLFDKLIPKTEGTRFHVEKSSDGKLLQLFLVANTTLAVQKKLVVCDDGTWSFTALNTDIPLESLDFPHGEDVRLLTPENIPMVLQYLEAIALCSGNMGFNQLCRAKNKDGPAVFLSKDDTVQAVEQDSILPGSNVDSTRPTTVRHVKCSVLDKKDAGQCDVCRIYKGDLKSMCLRQKNDDMPASRFKRNDLLSPKQVIEKLGALSQEKKTLKRKLNNLEERLSSRIALESVDVGNAGIDKCISDQIEKIMPEEEKNPRGIFWSQQMKYSRLNSKNGMRWHPLVIKWCIALWAKSPAAYNYIKDSKLISLPSGNTLRDYTLFTKGRSGFNPEFLKRMRSDFSDKINTYKKNVSIVFDEVKIKEGLVYSSETGELIGFCDLGDVNCEINELITSCSEEEEISRPRTATHILALMVRGIFDDLHVVFAHFPTVGFTSNQLFWAIWEAVGVLELQGFHVRAFIADGATPNRKFFRLHQDSDGHYYANNPHRRGEKIYFICDPPHLMKTVRNNWENSGWHNKTRNLEYNGQQIKWSQLVTMVEQDMNLQRDGHAEVGGLRTVPKIRHEHLYLTPSMRMKVSLATQVLSSSVARGFELTSVPHLAESTASTRKFCQFMDKFFDCLNVRNLYHYKHKRKEALAPYTDTDDPRFEWLVKDFLGFLKDWEDQCQMRNQLSKSERARLCLSRETLEGLRITVNAFTALAKELLQIPDVEFLLSGKFNQDPLELYFSKQRGCGGRNDNPSVAEFANNDLRLYVAGSRNVRASARGNCEVPLDDDNSVCQPLPRRKKLDLQ